MAISRFSTSSANAHGRGSTTSPGNWPPGKCRGRLPCFPRWKAATTPQPYRPGTPPACGRFFPAPPAIWSWLAPGGMTGGTTCWPQPPAALDYLASLHGVFNDDWILAVAAYNCGPGNVRRAIRRAGLRIETADYVAIEHHLPRETRSHMARWLVLSEIIAMPRLHNVRLKAIAWRPYFSEVSAQSQIDLAAAAKHAGIPLPEFSLLNLGLTRRHDGAERPASAAGSSGARGAAQPGAAANEALDTCGAATLSDPRRRFPESDRPRAQHHGEGADGSQPAGFASHPCWPGAADPHPPRPVRRACAPRRPTCTLSLSATRSG